MHRPLVIDLLSKWGVMRYISRYINMNYKWWWYTPRIQILITIKLPQIYSSLLQTLKLFCQNFSTVAKATHWVAKAWRGAWDKSGPLLKCTQLQYIIMIFESLMFLEVFHFFLMFLLKGVAADLRWWKKVMMKVLGQKRSTLKPTLTHSWKSPGIESITSI